MMAGIEAWWRGVMAAPVTLVALLVVVALSGVAAVRILPRLPGAAWRAGWSVLALGYVIAVLAFVAPPPERASALRPALITTGADVAMLATVSDQSDAFVTGRAWRERDVSEWLEGRASRAAPGRTVRISALDDLRVHASIANRLRVIGDGLDESDWARSTWSGQIVFDAPTLAPGFVAVDWSPRTVLGRPSRVAAAVSAGFSDDAQLVLRDASGVALAGAAASAGQIAGPVLPAGRHRLSLSLEDAGSERERVELPIEVREPIAARVLLLQSAPSFEWRSLARWLARAGARVAARTRVSDTRFRDRFDGLPERPLDTLDANLLSQFDLVVADGAALGILDAPSRTALLDTGHGAGVLVLVHDTADVTALPPQLRDLLEGDPERQALYQIEASAGILETGMTRLALTFSDAAGEALLSAVGGSPIVARVAPGDRVALGLLRDSYRLAGVGAREQHAALWSELVQSLARNATSVRARFTPERSRVGERLRVCVPRAAQLSAVRLRQDGGDDVMLPLTATSWRPAERCGWYWPEREGWLQVRAGAEGERDQGAHWVAPFGPLSRVERQARIAATARRQQTEPADAVLPTVAAAAMPRSRFLPWVLGLGVLLALMERLAMVRRRRATRVAGRS
ncbi:MAG: hypothetical protein AAFS02_09025 [Pseudomonadota bacterium]